MHYLNLKKVVLLPIFLIGFLCLFEISEAWNEPNKPPLQENMPCVLNKTDDFQPKTGSLTAGWLESKRFDSCNAGILNLVDSANNSNWHFTSRKPGCGGNNDFALWHFTGTNPGSGQSSDAWYGPYLWISKASGNVGIGASSPLYKLTVSGQGHFSQDGALECCSNGNFTLSLAENTSQTTKQATLRFINNEESEGSLKLNNGSDGRELLAESIYEDLDLRSTGVVRGEQGLCIGTSCRSQWPVILDSDKNCPSGQYVTGVDSSLNLICSNENIIYYDKNPCTKALPSSVKRIFVYSGNITGSILTSDAIADQKCQNAAQSAGLPGNYKALLYLGSRQPNTVFPSGATFWNGQKGGASGTHCIWHLVATSPNDFFTLDENGNYLVSSIRYNENGLESNVNVWTNFRPLGSGNYEVLPRAYSSSCGWTGSCLASVNRLGLCNCAWWGGACNRVWAMKAQAIYGSNTAKNSGWANDGMLDYSTQACTTSSCSQNAKTQCAANSMSLYCVEQ